MLRRTFTSNLLSSGATCQSCWSTPTQYHDEHLRPCYEEAKRASARLLDKVACRE